MSIFLPTFYYEFKSSEKLKDSEHPYTYLCLDKKKMTTILPHIYI